MERPASWQVAARLEDAAQAVKAASQALDAAYSILLNYAGTDTTPEVQEWSTIPGIDFVDRGMSDALKSMSDKYQAIADNEPDDRAEMELRTGFREEDFA